MTDSTEANRQFWNELTDIHWRSKFYAVDGFREGHQTLHDIELEQLGDVRDKSILHLQCHFGMDSLSLSRLGANVTGVDFSENAIARARALASEIGMKAEFICSDVGDLPNRLDTTFDIVFTSLGVLCWLPDLVAWANVIADFLKSGGTFVIVEEHPLSFILDEKSPPDQLRITYNYFDKSTLSFPNEGSYADREAPLQSEEHHEWTHTLDEIISSLLAAGLRLESFHEYPFAMFQRFPWLVKNDKGWWCSPDRPLNAPMLFSLKAVKP